MDVLQSIATWLYQADASVFAGLDAKVQLIVLGLLAVALFYFLMIFRPAPALGDVTGPQLDEDGRGGTPHWSVRTPADRALRLALPALKAVSLILLAMVWGAAALTHPQVAGWGLPTGPIFAVYGAVMSWIVIAKFWAMGRKARLTVVDSDDGTVRLNYWWVSELGLQESAKLRLGGRLGQGEAGVFWLNPGQKRHEIAIPIALKQRLGVDDGTMRSFTVSSTAGGAGPWPVLVALPLAYAMLGATSQTNGSVVLEPQQAAQCTPQVIEKEKIVEKVVERDIPKIVDREICTVFFDLDKASLNEAAKHALATVDGKSREPGVHVGVVGHTDTTGSVPYNQTLSEQRAAVTARVLENHGIPVATVEGRGEGDLAVPTPDQTLEPRNRRTVITIDPPVRMTDVPTQ